MTKEEMKNIFESFNDDFTKFDQLEDPITKRRDLLAFIILDSLVEFEEEKAYKIIGASEHDVIWINIDTEKLAEIITEELIHDLVRCGVMYDDDIDSLKMFT